MKIYKNLKNQIWSFPDLRDFLKNLKPTFATLGAS